MWIPMDADVWVGLLFPLFCLGLFSPSFQMFLYKRLVKLQANNLVFLVRRAGTSVAGYLFINLPSLL